MAYIGNQPNIGNWRKLDDISGSFNGATTSFTTSVAGENITAASANQLFISLGGVIQEPGVDFTVTTNTITFTTAPASGLNFFGVYAGDSLNIAGPSDGTVGTSALQDGAVTSAKILDGTIVDADVNASAAIAYSKLSLTGSIVNADINASAAIVDTKLATISTAGKVSGTAITSGNISTSGSISTTNALSTTSTLAVGQASAAANTDLDLAGTYAQTIVSVAALDINCSTGNYFIKTINGSSTFTVSNIPSSRAYSFTLELTHTSGTITWFSGVEWPNGTPPTLTTGKTHLFMFVTDDGGSRWRASSLINYTN